MQRYVRDMTEAGIFEWGASDVMGNIEAYDLGGYEYIDLINSEILLFSFTFYELFKLEVKKSKVSSASDLSSSVTL